jgi:hypothetical protein
VLSPLERALERLRGIADEVDIPVRIDVGRFIRVPIGAPPGVRVEVRVGGHRVGGGRIDALNLQATTHTVRAILTDASGATVRRTSTVRVQPTAQGLQRALKRARSSGLVSKAAYRRLARTLRSVRAAKRDGRRADQVEHLERFLRQLRSKRTGKIDADFARYARSWARDVIRQVEARIAADRAACRAARGHAHRHARRYPEGVSTMPRRVAGMAALAVALGIAGCGDERREPVADYLDALAVVQQRSAPALGQAAEAYAAFAEAPERADRVLDPVKEAESAMRRARDEMARVRAPADARRLHRLVVAVYTANLAMAQETAALAGYLDALRAPLLRLDRENRRLVRRLDGSELAAGQLEALRRYRRGLDAVIDGLGELEPPPALEPQRDDQVRRLRSVRRLVGRLSATIDEGRTEEAASLVRRVRELAGNGGSERQRRALEAYEARQRDLAALVDEAERERLALQERLG